MLRYRRVLVRSTPGCLAIVDPHSGNENAGRPNALRITCTMDVMRARVIANPELPGSGTGWIFAVDFEMLIHDLGGTSDEEAH